MASPTIARVDPSKVILLLSSNEPEVPASTILLSVKSDTVAELKVVSAPEKFAPALPSTKAENVATPATTTSSKSVRPSTSKLPSASILLDNVATPVTTTSSKSARPSTSKLPFASISVSYTHLRAHET